MREEGKKLEHMNMPMHNLKHLDHLVETFLLEWL